MSMYQNKAQQVRDKIVRTAFGSTDDKAMKNWELVTKAHQAMRSGKWDSVVYFIRLESRIKIGTSTNLKLRLRDLPWDSVELVIRGDEIEERLLHQRFEHIRVQGEWFRAKDELIDYIEKMRDKLKDENEMRFPDMPPFPWGMDIRLPGPSKVQRDFLRHYLRDHLESEVA